MSSPERCQVMKAGLDELGLVRQEEAGKPAQRAGDDIGGELVGEGVEPDRLHAHRVLARAAQHAPEARGDDRAAEEIGADEAGEDDVVEGVALAEDARSEDEALPRQGHAVVAAIGGERGGEEVQHLPEGKRDHDEVDALRPQRDRAGDEREQGRGGERRRELHEGVADAVAHQDADRIGADAEEGGVAEADERAVAEDEVERHRGDAEDHDAQDERQDVALAAMAGEGRGDGEEPEQDDGQDVAAPPRRAGRRRDRDLRGLGGKAGHRFTGKRPVGRKNRTAAIRM